MDPCRTGDQVSSIVGAVVRAVPSAAVPESAAAMPQQMAQLAEVCRQLATESALPDGVALATRALVNLTRATRATCLFYEAKRNELRPGFGPFAESRVRTASTGLAGFAAHTGESAVAERAACDARYCQAVDDPEGTGEERILVQPVCGPSSGVLAVVVLVRGGQEEAFDAAQSEMVALLAQFWGPALELLLRGEGTGSSTAATTEGGLFRAEALEAYERRTDDGDVVRVSPEWMRWAYRLLVALLVAGIAFVFFGTLNYYSTGPAVIRQSGRTEVVAVTAGTLLSMEVSEGDHVQAGQVLARFHDASERAALRQLEREVEARLVDVLRDLSDVDARRHVATLTAQKERARAALEERLARAPHDGVVGDVRARPGMYLAPGQVVMTVSQSEDELSVVALLPGRDRPRLEVGQEMRFELSGHAGVRADLTIDSVADGVIGPAEARRTLGQGIGDSVRLDAPVVVVRGHLCSATFEAFGEMLRYHDGMHGHAEAITGEESVLLTLVPSLKELKLWAR